MQETGSIKRFYQDRGFGFIKREMAPDVFFHVRDVRNLEDENALVAGAPVEFEAMQDPRGWRAVNVALVDEGA